MAEQFAFKTDTIPEPAPVVPKPVPTLSPELRAALRAGLADKFWTVHDVKAICMAEGVTCNTARARALIQKAINSGYAQTAQAYKDANWTPPPE